MGVGSSQCQQLRGTVVDLRGSQQPMANSCDIPPDWMSWITENQRLGVPDTTIIKIMVDNGFDAAMAQEKVARSGNRWTPSISDLMARKLNKLESLMIIYSKLWQCRGTVGVDRVSGLSCEAFFRWYYSTNTPVVLLDLMSNWSALQRWTPQYLKARCGHEIVEVMTGRNADPQYEMNCEFHKTHMPLAQYIDNVESIGETNDFYIVANNHSLDTGNMGQLLDDIQFFDGILDPRNARQKVFLWFGPAGTVTPLHHETMNVLFAQVLGRKLITLIPSFETNLVYNHVGVYSEVDCEAPDYNRHPLFRNVSRLEVLLEPGEVLFIPVGWWHHVRSLDISISVSFTNFLASNDYDWDGSAYRP